MFYELYIWRIKNAFVKYLLSIKGRNVLYLSGHAIKRLINVLENGKIFFHAIFIKERVSFLIETIQTSSFGFDKIS